MDKLFTYTDGGSRGNPGHSAIAILITKGTNEDDEKGRIIFQHGEYIGIGTNNQAEYKALIKALQESQKLSRGDILCTLDSELVVRQLIGEYKVKSSDLKPLYEEVKLLEKSFKSVSYRHVRRENPFIQKADSMVNNVLDENGY